MRSNEALVSLRLLVEAVLLDGEVLYGSGDGRVDSHNEGGKQGSKEGNNTATTMLGQGTGWSETASAAVVASRQQHDRANLLFGVELVDLLRARGKIRELLPQVEKLAEETQEGGMDPNALGRYGWEGYLPTLVPYYSSPLLRFSISTLLPSDPILCVDCTPGRCLLTLSCILHYITPLHFLTFSNSTSPPSLLPSLAPSLPPSSLSLFPPQTSLFASSTRHFVSPTPTPHPHDPSPSHRPGGGGHRCTVPLLRPGSIGGLWCSGGGDRRSAEKVHDHQPK